MLNEKTYDTMHLHEPNGFQQVNAEKELATGMNVYTLRKYQIMLVALVSGWPQVAVERMPIRQIQEAFDFLAPFITSWPSNWRELAADLAYFWHWQPSETWALTGPELLWWLEQANRIIARENARRGITYQD